jgi:hypothetical protein
MKPQDLSAVAVYTDATGRPRASPCRPHINALRDAKPEHKLDVYRNLGLRLTYDPETRTVLADIDLATHRWASVRVRGVIDTVTPCRTSDEPEMIFSE